MIFYIRNLLICWGFGSKPAGMRFVWTESPGRGAAGFVPGDQPPHVTDASCASRRLAVWQLCWYTAEGGEQMVGR